MAKLIPIRQTQQSGFTLLEMLISVALLLTLGGAILGGMATMQKNYRRNEIRTVLNGQMRATLELLAQEVGQAGLPASGMAGNAVYLGSGASGAEATVTSNVLSSDLNTSLTVNVSTATNQIATVQTGQMVIADSGTSAEVVKISGTSGGAPITQIQATFSKLHTAPFALYAHGVYPQAITFQTTPPTTAGSNTSYSNTSLIAVGDITGRGALAIVEYSCPVTNPGLTGGTAPSSGNLATIVDISGAQWGPLIRTEYTYNDATGLFSTSPSTLLSLVRVATTANGTPADGCRFDYNIYKAPATALGCTPWWMVTSINVTLIGESQTNDPQTNAPVTITKSFMNIQPRNILNGYNLFLDNYNNTTTPSADNCSEFLSLPTVVGNQIATFTQ